MPRRGKSPAEVPAGAARRLALLGSAGAGMAGRSSLAALRKAAAAPERRRQIEREVQEANALQLFGAMSRARGLVMKAGQLLAQQAYALPPSYVEALSDLHWAAPPMHGTLARLQVRNELGRFPEELFADFERQPFAAASLGQVHGARLPDGREAAVKVQYPGIERSLASDISILAGLLRAAGLGGERHPEVEASLAEVRSRFLEEADYEREAGNQEELGRALASSPDFVVPRVFRELSSRRVLTQERLFGAHVREYLAAGPSQAARDRLAHLLLDLFFFQTLALGLLQADPNPGNFLFLADGRIGLLDFGCVKRFDAAFLTRLRRLFELPVDDEAALDACYREFGLYDPAAPRAAEQRAALLELQRLDTGKYHQDRPFDFREAVYLRQLAACLTRHLRLGLANPQFILYVRTKLGLYDLFHQLGARVDCRRVLAAYL